MKDIITNDSILNYINACNPVYQIQDKEFSDFLLKFGSLLSILKNKKINHTMMMTYILENNDYMTSLKIITGIDETSILLYNILTRYPILCKSKIIKNKIEELHGNKKRKRRI